MSIRIGSSCVLSMNMIRPECKVVETRHFLDVPTQWYEIATKCIAEKIFLIVTLCIDKNGKLEYIPSESQWRNFVEDSTVKLLSLGANWNNCRIDLVNEPCKYIDKSTYAYLVNLAHNQINGRLPVGAGCEEFVTAQAKGDMYPHLLRYGNFETLVIHIQGSCLAEDACSRWTNLALNWATSYKKKLDCNEANYFSINTDSGYKGLLMNLKYAEKVGCANFPMVFINLDRSAFSGISSNILDGWERLAFFVNGKQHSNYWNDFKNIIESKAPVPNIILLPIERRDGMIIQTQTIANYDVYLAQLENELLWKLGYLQEEDITWSITQKTVNALKKFQNAIINKYPKIIVDGECGRQMFRYLAQEISDSIERENYRFAIECYASPTK